jgi:quercetin dioxygenase-like cupin family protein
MTTLIKIILIYASFTVNALGHIGGAQIIEHNKVKAFSMKGNLIQGLATKAHGAREFEVWRSEMGVGKATPLHKHSSEEVFVVLKGKVEITVGKSVRIATAPVTIIAPANTMHQVRNIGNTKTEQIVILGIGSKIWNAKNRELKLPWRK